MSGILESLLRIKDASETKSYLIGFERGRIWAEEYADYFEMREWSEVKVDECNGPVFPQGEGEHFRIICAETPIEWQPYLKGWVEGVKEILQKY